MHEVHPRYLKMIGGVLLSGVLIGVAADKEVGRRPRGLTRDRPP
jgi:hypothetical protein